MRGAGEGPMLRPASQRSRSPCPGGVAWACAWSPDSASPAKVTAMHIHCRAVWPADFLQTTVPIRLTDDVSPERLSHLPGVTQQVQLRLKPWARGVGRGCGAWGGALVPMGMRCPPSQSLAGAGPKLRGPGPHDEQGCPPRVLSVGAAWRAGGTCVRPGVSRQRGVCSEEPAPGPQHRLTPAGCDQAGGGGTGGRGNTRGVARGERGLPGEDGTRKAGRWPGPGRAGRGAGVPRSGGPAWPAGPAARCGGRATGRRSVSGVCEWSGRRDQAAPNESQVGRTSPAGGSPGFDQH